MENQLHNIKLQSPSSAIIPVSFCGYKISTKFLLTPSQLKQLTDAFELPPGTAHEALGGRKAIGRINVDSLGPVVVKHYRRGGILEKFNSQYYLKTSKTRAQTEFEQMELARSLGVGAPEPVAHASVGLIFYRAWLVTRQIEGATTMAALARTSPECAKRAMERLCHQVNIMINSSIIHADFHPGNVLVDEAEQVYIIDFDKAKLGRTAPRDLSSRYRERWCRAVKKHHLPQMLCTLLDLS